MINFYDYKLTGTQVQILIHVMDIAYPRITFDSDQQRNNYFKLIKYLNYQYETQKKERTKSYNNRYKKMRKLTFEQLQKELKTKLNRDPSEEELEDYWNQERSLDV